MRTERNLTTIAMAMFALNFSILAFYSLICVYKEGKTVLFPGDELLIDGLCNEGIFAEDLHTAGRGNKVVKVQLDLFAAVPAPSPLAVQIEPVVAVGSFGE